METEKADRIRGALYGLVIGDALAMPVHWYYDPKRLEQDYGKVSEMMAPMPTHPESMLAGMSYGGSIDILHDKAPLYEGHSLNTSKKLSEEEIAKRTDLHGNFVGKLEDERIHYHRSLKKGQNTTNVCVARLLMRYLAESCQGGVDGYDPRVFVERFSEYMQTKPEESDEGQVKNHNDTYLDVYARFFFEQASKGVPLIYCAHNQRDSWSIGSLDGAVMAVPIIAAYQSNPVANLIGRAIEHHMLTHKSVTVSAAVSVLALLLQDLFDGKDPDLALDRAMEMMQAPKITGIEMADSYVNAHGPGRIPNKEKWDQHMVTTNDGTTLKDTIRALISKGVPERDVGGFTRSNARFATACYTEQSMAIVFYLACKYGTDFRAALSANAEMGGHSTARGAILGAILGARVGVDNIPHEWIEGLAAPSQVGKEVNGVIEVALAMPNYYQ